MPLTLDATVGGASSNSYASLADALSYATEGAAVSASAFAWLTLSEEVQKSRLLTATRALDTSDFASARLTADQRLEFPRVKWPSIPRDLVEATIELALTYPATATSEPLNPVVNDKKRVEAGDVSVEYFDRGALVATAASRFPLFVQALIEQYLAVELYGTWGTGTSVRGS